MIRKSRLRLFPGIIVSAIVLALLSIPFITPLPANADTTRAVIDLSPRQGPVGSKVIVILGYFEPGTVDISFDAESNIVETCSTDDDGNAYTYFIVDEYPAGDYKVWAKDDTNREYTIFTITQEIELSLSTGYVGDEVIVNGTGFAAMSELSIQFDNEEVAIDKTDEDGCFAGATFKVPESCCGTHTIKAIDKENNFANSSFNTKHSVTTSATSGNVGTGVTITGTGFAGEGDITITFANEKVAIGKSDDLGSFSDSFVVPAMVKGDYRIKISDGTNSDYANFSIEAVTTINPTEGNVGTEVTASGSGFSALSKVTVKYDKDSVATTSTDDSGKFKALFSVPKSKHGKHTITVTDSATTATMEYTMEETAPDAPRLLLPESGTKVSETPTFGWEQVNDPSGVTYDFQVASDQNFSTLLIDKGGLTDPEYVVTAGESLLPTKKESPYYWRVRAIDNADNKSQWSAKGSFFMGSTLATPPGWVQWGLTGLGITLFGFLFGTFLNKLRRLAIGD
jgi:hypothetical protein